MSGPTLKCLGTVLALLALGAGTAFAQAASEDRHVGEFSRLAVQDGIDVDLAQSAEPSLRIEVEGYELGDVVSKVEGDELRLSRKRTAPSGFLTKHRITAYVGFVQLSSVEASGGSDLHGRDDMRFDELSVRASGGSDIDLAVEAARLQFVLSGGSDLKAKGSAESLSIEASGGSDVAAASLEAKRVRLVLSGGSDASVRASAAIDVDSHSGSDVAVYGNPAERRVSNDRSSDIRWR